MQILASSPQPCWRSSGQEVKLGFPNGILDLPLNQTHAQNELSYNEIVPRSMVILVHHRNECCVSDVKRIPTKTQHPPSNTNTTWGSPEPLKAWFHASPPFRVDLGTGFAPFPTVSVTGHGHGTPGFQLVLIVERPKESGESSDQPHQGKSQNHGRYETLESLESLVWTTSGVSP